MLNKPLRIICNLKEKQKNAISKTVQNFNRFCDSVQSIIQGNVANFRILLVGSKNVNHIYYKIHILKTV